MDDDVCCDACAKVADSLLMNTENINTLYTALVSEGLNMGLKNLITSFSEWTAGSQTSIFHSCIRKQR